MKCFDCGTLLMRNYVNAYMGKFCPKCDNPFAHDSRKSSVIDPFDFVIRLDDRGASLVMNARHVETGQYFRETFSRQTIQGLKR